MSMDEAGSGKPLETAAEPKRKGTRSRPAKVRKHTITTVEKQKAALALDALYAGGSEIAFIVPSGDIRGFEIISYREE